MTYSLPFVNDAHTRLVHHRVQLLPRLSPVPGAIDSSDFRLNKNDLVGITAPHDVKQWPVDLEDLETNLVLIHSIYYVNHISCISIEQHAH